MNLFSELDGKSGEEQSSAILNYLLLRSPVIRDSFLKVISISSHLSVPISDGRQFTSYLEVATTSQQADGENLKGRIDLVVETENAVIGIENKFNASFQEDQPRKYLSFLEKRAKELNSISGKTEVVPLLVVLAPKSRVSSIYKRFKEQGIEAKSFFVSWEDLLRGISDNTHVLDPAGAFLASDLKSYVNEYIGFSDFVRTRIPFLRRNWENRGSADHREVVNTLWSTFPENTRVAYRSGVGHSYYGYYFGPGEHDQRWNWYGFIDAETLVDTDLQADGKACFMIATSPRVEDLQLPEASALRKAEITGWTDDSGHPRTCWILNFGDDWTDRDRWEDAISPLAGYLSSTSKDA